MLTLKSVQAGYGRLPVLKGISLHVRAGEVVTLIGGNGAGKTTTLRTISGLLPPRKGVIEFAGQDLTRLAAERIVTLGLALVPEGRRVFRTLSVTANLELGAFHRRDKGEVRRDLEEIRERFPILKERAHQAAGTLSGGEQQILVIGRALMARPRLLMLDEPSMGLAPRMVAQVYDILAKLKGGGTTILLVEQNARAALKVADRGYVLETGRIILDGSAADLRDDPEVQRAYLGKGYREVWE
jgi:branched-chain amino acid transport system ATP-binding protein